MPATPKPNLAARTAVAFQNCGCATLTTIAVMTLMNQLTCAVSETARQDGRDAPASLTIVASRNGFSAMERTIAATTATNFQRTARFANPKQTSSARTTDAYPSNGLVTLLTTVEMDLTNRKRSAKENIVNVPNQSSDATTENVFLADGDVVSGMNVDAFLRYSKVPSFRSRRRLR